MEQFWTKIWKILKILLKLLLRNILSTIVGGCLPISRFPTFVHRKGWHWSIECEANETIPAFPVHSKKNGVIVSTKNHHAPVLWILESSTAETRILLLHYPQSEENLDKSMFEVHDVFISFCPFHGSLKGTLFWSNEFHLKIFIANGISSFVFVSADHYCNQERCLKMTEHIETLVNVSKVLPKSCRSKHNEVLSSKKKRAKTYFFVLLATARHLQREALKEIIA